jgi:hypothetical protein
MKIKLLALVLLASFSAIAYASGAPWYKWKNLTNRTVMCSQIRPGEVWVMFQGPFMESGCRKPGYPQ